MALTTAANVRLLSNLTTSDISDSDLNSLISLATKEIFSKLNVRVTREFVTYIDGTRENKIDGANATYYVQNWKGKYLADYNLDDSVTTSDVKTFIVDSDGNETESIPSSITFDDGKFVLSSAPASDKDLYVTYAYSFIDESTPDPLLGLACAYLVASYAYLKIDSGATDVKFGNVQIRKKASDNYSFYYSRYDDIMKQLNKFQALAGDNWVDAKVRI